MTKTCTVCREDKALTSYHRSKACKDGYHTQCIPCRKEVPSLSSGAARARDLRNKYGMSVVQFLAMAQHQGEACAICKNHGKLVVDHDHETGEVRGLLCVGCNVLVGPSGKHAERLRKALAYVEKK